MSPKSTCIKQTTKKYTQRKRPPFPAEDCKGMRMKGNDGKLYESRLNDKGVYTWRIVPTKTRMGKGKATPKKDAPQPNVHMEENVVANRQPNVFGRLFTYMYVDTNNPREYIFETVTLLHALGPFERGQVFGVVRIDPVHGVLRVGAARKQYSLDVVF